jgi:phytoene synthase
MMMTLDLRTWEHALLSMAHEAQHATATDISSAVRDTVLLDFAYTRSTLFTAKHSRSFFIASALLPAEQQRAVRALYAFCRRTDDLVDCPQDDVEAALAAWRERALSPEPPISDPIAVAWADARLRYRIPRRYAEQLIDGVARDLHQTRYCTFEELTTYAYGVASTVGLMSMHIIGFANAEAIPYAIKLGVALQLTNILRDVGEDWRAGRVYLPADELATYGLSEDDIAAGRVDARWRAFMRFQITRNRRLYEEAWPGIAMLDRRGRFAVATAGELYLAILDDIETHDYDVFNRRAHVSTPGKLRRLPGIWRRSRRTSYQGA